jgi:CRP-like cAMP-binding protein
LPTEDSARSTGKTGSSAILELLRGALPATSAETRGVLAQAARVERFGGDVLVWRQGGELRLTLVLRGYAAFRRTTLEGQNLMLGIAGPGALYGFVGVTRIRPPVDMVTLTETEVATWPGAELRRLILSDSGLAIDAIDSLSRSAAILTEKLDGFLHQNARRRVIRVLARHRDLFFEEPVILSRSHLPGLVGTSREMTGRVLRELEQEGILARVGRTGLRMIRPELFDAEARDLPKSAT